MRIATTALVIGALIATAACGRKTPCEKAEEVVESFYQSMRFGDAELAFQLISSADKRILTERAKSASARTGKDLEPHEMLVPRLVSFKGDLSGAAFKPINVEAGDVRLVEVTFREGHTVRATVVREAGCYRIPLDL
ncbi:MAG: hypothetical protein JRG91_19795, partial [Deltaproteobacteria bacterium]|nr:hypothetical protein [Deltaproteobacteria bacterium]